jgi:hypothetical protein
MEELVRTSRAVIRNTLPSTLVPVHIRTPDMPAIEMPGTLLHLCTTCHCTLPTASYIVLLAVHTTLQNGWHMQEGTGYRCPNQPTERKHCWM